MKITVSGVNPSDVKGRRGRPLTWPRIIPHSDGAGVIDAVGDGVDHRNIGERVWLWNAQWKRAFGTAAEYCVLAAEQAVKLPNRVEIAAGACLGIPALTALQAVRLHGPIAGKTLLVTGAGSAVGHYATQIAKARGARVIGTASDAKADHARHSGADFVVDYKKKDVAKVTKELTRGEGVDGVIDMDLSTTAAAHRRRRCQAARHDRVLRIECRGRYPDLVSSDAVQQLRAEDLPRLRTQARRPARGNPGTHCAARGRNLKHSVGARFRLRDIAAAHDAVEGGKVIGNVVLDIG